MLFGTLDKKPFRKLSFALFWRMSIQINGVLESMWVGIRLVSHTHSSTLEDVLLSTKTVVEHFLQATPSTVKKYFGLVELVVVVWLVASNAAAFICTKLLAARFQFWRISPSLPRKFCCQPLNAVSF